MTLDIAKLIEKRRIAEGDPRPPEDSIYVMLLVDACRPVGDGGGGLLERHAMLEELWAAVVRQMASKAAMAAPHRDCVRCDRGGVCRETSAMIRESRDADERLAVVVAALMDVDDALPPGKGET